MTSETIAQGAAIGANLKQFLLVLLVSLSVATLSQEFHWFRQIPYTLLLVIVGLGLAFFDVRLVNLSPQLILLIFLPPLLFEAAWNLEWSYLKRDLVPINLYAVLGVVISVAGVAGLLKEVAGVPLSTALLVGASISATDPVSVIALFRELGVGKRLSTLMEAESLFNDGIAVVAFSVLGGIALGTDKFSIHHIVAQFFTVMGIGIGVGLLIGFGISYLTQRFDLPFVEQSLTLVAAYGTYVIVDDLGGSGVIGVVTVGLVLGNFGSRFGMKPSTRLVISEFLEFLAFLINSIVFLLIGDQIKLASLKENLWYIIVAIAAVIITRAIAIYALSGLSNWLVKSQISYSFQTVLWWGGLRGSVSIALALSVPGILPDREQTIAIVFGVVLFTLLVQGLTTKPLLDKLGLLSNQSLMEEYQQTLARRVALNQVLLRLSQLANRKEIEPAYHLHLIALIQEKINCVLDEINQFHQQHPQLENQTIKKLKQELLAVESDTYAEFIRSGSLHKFPSSLLQEVFSDCDEG